MLAALNQRHMDAPGREPQAGAGTEGRLRVRLVLCRACRRCARHAGDSGQSERRAGRVARWGSGGSWWTSQSAGGRASWQ